MNTSITDIALIEKLTTCFRAVFPLLPEANIPSASVATVTAWDSLAAITLVHVIEEEFETEVDLDELAKLDSFASIAHFLLAKTARN